MISTKFYIYTIINLNDGKIYIGQTNNPVKRFSNHRRNVINRKFQYAPRLYRAINKHGINAFDFSILSEYENQHAVNKAEQALIFALDTANPRSGYNIKLGGDNRRHSQEIKDKISQANKGKIGNRLGTTHSPESKKRMSLIQLGKPGRNPSKAERDHLRQLYKGKTWKLVDGKRVWEIA